MSRTYRVLSYRTQADADGRGGCADERTTETIAEAKMWARRSLTEEYRALNGMSTRLGYAKVINDAGECIFDCFAKGGPVMKEYHFSFGDSNSGPVGYCAGIRASSKAEAVKRLRKHLLVYTAGAPVELRHARPGEYVTAYFNEGYVNEDDIDEVCDLGGNVVEEKD